MKVALVYDRVNKWGGAERVLLALHKLFPDAPLYTSIYDPNNAPWAKVFDVKTSFLQKLPRALRRHEWLAPLMPLAFESFNFDQYDLVISVTSEAAKGIITKPQTHHICYCLTPTRYLWSSYEDYFQDELLETLARPIIFYLRAWDKIASSRPDKFIAISKEVQGRIKKYYSRESEVIYPPATLRIARRAGPLVNTNFFLVVSRLVTYKRVDIVVEAFNDLGWPLKIVGSGVESGKLRSIAKNNISFHQNLTDSELVRYYEDCTALISAGVEDFGLSIIEAQSSGKSVISYQAGGATESITAGVTGEFFQPQTKEALVKILKKFNYKDYKREDCIKNANKFSHEKFKKEFKNLI